MNLTEDGFNQFLNWLDPDRERAGQRYEHIRRTLIVIFTARGCAGAEDLADETINRVIRRVPELAQTYVGDPVPYFRVVAAHLHLEYCKRLKRHAIAPDPLPLDVPAPPAAQQEENDYACLEHCLKQLAPTQRDLILNYYQENKQAKIDYRKRLAKQLGVALNALRIRAHRIRNELQKCLDQCLEQQAG